MSETLEAVAAKQSHLKYRPDIDGLRAIAVVPVVIFHLFHEFFPGGFLGVDIFFVISGFLITSILVKDCSAGNYSIVTFYERRIRRIIPALFFVLFCTAAAAMLILLPTDLIGFAKSTLATLLFASNIFFWRDTNYFSTDAMSKPLLHTWSLGIEEQFYIFFPLIVFYVLRRWPERTLLWLCITLTGISFVLNVAMLQMNLASPAFYLLPTRAWELGIGACACLIGRNHPANLRLGPIMAWLGLVFVLASLAFVDQKSLAPLPAATFLCPGVALLIWGAAETGMVKRLLSLKPLISIGLISYSLYLWHWPVYVLYRYYIVRETTFLESSALTLASFALAWVSWRFVERPFRTRQMTMPRLFAWNAAPGLAIAAFIAIAVLTTGLPTRFDAKAASFNRNVGDIYHCPLNEVTVVHGVRACNVNGGTGTGKPVHIALLGNSHALMYVPAFEKALKQQQQPGLLFYSNGCIPVEGLNRTPGCVASQDANIRAVIADEDIRVVAIAFAWQGLRDPMFDETGKNVGIVPQATLLARMDKVVEAITASGKHVVLIGPIPDPGYNVASVVSREVAYHGRPQSPLSQKRESFDSEFAEVNAWLTAQSSAVTVLHPSQSFCDAEACRYTFADTIAYADDNHLAQSTVKQMASYFSPLVSLALGQPARVETKAQSVAAADGR